MNWTLPVGVVVTLTGITVAVKVTGWPNTGADAFEVTAVFAVADTDSVPVLDTVWVPLP
jgi:hypothetical protein